MELMNDSEYSCCFQKLS